MNTADLQTHAPRGHLPWRKLRDRLAAIDARLYQILFLATLLSIGVLARDFSLRPEQMALTFAAGLATQAVAVRLLGLRKVGLLSALITCFGLSILLRADTLWVHPLAAFLAIGAKFVIRVNGKHLFNPANLGVIAGITLLPGAWISPGQWGSDLIYAAWFVALGSIVTNRSRRMDISWMFLGCYVLRATARGARAVAGAVGRDLLAPVAQRGAAAVCIFHDFRPDDHPQSSARAARLRRSGGRWRLPVAVLSVQTQRAGVGVVSVDAAGAAARPPVASTAS